eukprot:2425592-Pyramimonas_sp.AAC.1
MSGLFGCMVRFVIQETSSLVLVIVGNSWSTGMFLRPPFLETRCQPTPLLSLGSGAGCSSMARVFATLWPSFRVVLGV